MQSNTIIYVNKNLSYCQSIEKKYIYICIYKVAADGHEPDRCSLPDDTILIHHQKITTRFLEHQVRQEIRTGA